MMMMIMMILCGDDVDDDWRNGKDKYDLAKTKPTNEGPGRVAVQTYISKQGKIICCFQQH